MLTLDKTLLKILQSDRLAAFKNGTRHFIRSWPQRDNWDLVTEIELPGTVRGTAYGDCSHMSLPERGACSWALDYRTKDLFHLLRPSDRIELQWWPNCNSPWLEKHDMTRDLLTLLVDRKEGKGYRRLELELAESITGPDNASIRMCKGFPAPHRHAEDAA